MERQKISMKPADKTEFLKLLKPHYNIAVKYCHALARKGNSEQAEDIFQTAVLKAIEKFETLDDKDKFKYWFFTIITNVFRDSVRRNFWSRFVTLEEEHEKAPGIFFQESRNSDNTDILLKALSKLSNKEKTALLLFELGGFTIAEITTIQKEKSESCIKQRLARSREKLKLIISRLESEFSDRKLSYMQFEADIESETLKLISEIKSAEK